MLSDDCYLFSSTFLFDDTLARIPPLESGKKVKESGGMEGRESTPTGNAGGRNFFFMRWLGRLRDLSLVSEEFLGLLLPNPGDEQPLLSAEYRAPA